MSDVLPLPLDPDTAKLLVQAAKRAVRTASRARDRRLLLAVLERLEAIEKAKEKPE